MFILFPEPGRGHGLGNILPAGGVEEAPNLGAVLEV